MLFEGGVHPSKVMADCMSCNHVTLYILLLIFSLSYRLEVHGNSNEDGVLVVGRLRMGLRILLAKSWGPGDRSSCSSARFNSIGSLVFADS